MFSDRHVCEITGAPHAVAAAAQIVNDQIADLAAGGQGAGLTPQLGGGVGGGGGGGGYAHPGGGGGGYGGYQQPQRQQYGGYQPQQQQHQAYGGYPPQQQQQQYGGYPPQQVQAPAGPALTGASGLPHAWQELASEGQVYYWNTETGATQYERPM